MKLGQVKGHEVLEQYDSVFRVQIWDTGGMEMTKAVNKNYVREVDGMVLVCDLTQPDTAEQLMMWSQEVVDVKPMPMAIVANKVDLAVTSVQPVRQEDLTEL